MTRHSKHGEHGKGSLAVVALVTTLTTLATLAMLACINGCAAAGPIEEVPTTIASQGGTTPKPLAAARNPSGLSEGVVSGPPRIAANSR